MTDAPVDNMGKGEAFSPTDLVATALGTCMLTIMGILAKRHEINIEGTTASVVKEMVSTPMRRIGRLIVTIQVPAKVGDEDRKRFAAAVLACPVHKSLHPDIDIQLQFKWG